MPGRGLQQADHRVADQGRRLRRARAHAAGRWSRSTRTRSTRSSTIKRNEAIGQDSTSSAASTTDADGGSVVPSRCPTSPEWDKQDTARPSSARCSASTSPTTRCSGLEHVLSRRGRLLDRAADRATTDRPDGVDGHHRRPDHLAAAQDHQAGQRLGDRHRRGPRRRDRGAVLPADLPDRLARARRGRVVVVKGRLNRRDDVPTIYARSSRLPDSRRGRPRAGRGLDAGRRGAPRRWSSGSRTCSAPTPGRPRCTCG